MIFPVEGSPRQIRTGNDESRFAWVIVPAISLAVGGFIRLEGLGVPSLWADEFCTWHVSRMPLADSVRWGPELTKPPLYQISVRAITREPRPSEAVLRAPAALAGLLAVVAMFDLGRRVGGPLVGACSAALAAVNPLFIELSREARPYSMLLLGAVLSVSLWCQLVLTPRLRLAAAYVVVTVLAFHAHYLIVLTVAAQVLWLIFIAWGRRAPRMMWLPVIGLFAVGALCVPAVLHYLAHRTSVFQGLSWIAQPTFAEALRLSASISFGSVWMLLVWIPCLIGWLAGFMFRSNSASLWHRLYEGRQDGCWLLLCWLLCAWGGLVLISFTVQPALIDRYALPAAAPLLLWPLVVLCRLSPRWTCAATAVFVLIGLAHWIKTPVGEPGFRELSAYLASTVERDRELVVQVVNPQPAPDWLEGERLAFAYYPVSGIEIEELHVEADGVTPTNDILSDPRAMYLVVFQSDPFVILQAAGRRAEPLSFRGREYSQLPFLPYRVVKVAPRDGS